MTILQNIAIISGGQTGADRAALDFAIAHGIPHDGWCPRRRRAEDGAIPLQYALRETPSAHYSQRTRWNIRDSDATLVFSIGPRLAGGTRLTLETAKRLGKPVLHLSGDESVDQSSATTENDLTPTIDAAAAKLRAFLEEHQVSRLNIAGPRESQEPNVAVFVADVLQRALTD